MMLTDALKIIAGVQDPFPFAKQAGCKVRDKEQEAPWTYKDRVALEVKRYACKIVAEAIRK